MTTSINAFKANFSGGARPNQFRVFGNFPSVVTDGNDAQKKISFLCTAASLPESQLGTITVDYRGRQFKYAGDRTFDAWEITVWNDEDMHIRNAFESWSNLISTHESNLNPLIEFTYMQDWRVQQLDRNGLVIAEYNIIQAYPQSVSAIPLEMSSTDTPEQFSVTMEYMYWTRLKPDQTTDGIPGTTGLGIL
jgi:hypothetical protein